MSKKEVDLKKYIESGDIEGLLNILDIEEDWMICFDAAEALAQLGNEQGVDYLIDSLQDDDEEKRTIAKEILEGLDSQRGNQALSQIKPISRQQPDNVLIIPIPNLRNFMVGFLGWYLVFSIYWGTVNFIFRDISGSATMGVIFYMLPPLPANIIALIIFTIKPRWRWIAVGIASAIAINLIVSFLFDSSIAFFRSLISIPFFMK